jgi:hypothetical protein
MTDVLEKLRTTSDRTPDRTPLAARLAEALDRGPDQLSDLSGREPAGRRDRALTLRRIHELHTAPLAQVGDRARWQHHPVVAELKQRLEAAWSAELDAAAGPLCDHQDASAEMRALAARDRSPAIYRWIANEAPWDAAMHFLALEGGPDDVFDDLVALCQVGLPIGSAKMELAGNYWDELGNGEFAKVHNVLYRGFVEAVDLPTIVDNEQPTEALERSALLGLVATNRALQPEMVGALGLIELEAGPHCRYVDRGLERLGASDEAREFYQMHAVVDPVHGHGWLENAVGPLVAERPDWGPRILRGARWKSLVNNRFFDWAERTLATDATGGSPSRFEERT